MAAQDTVTGCAVAGWRDRHRALERTVILSHQRLLCVAMPCRSELKEGDTSDTVPWEPNERERGRVLHGVFVQVR